MFGTYKAEQPSTLCNPIILPSKANGLRPLGGAEGKSTDHTRMCVGLILTKALQGGV
jgi:hypothetical protein